MNNFKERVKKNINFITKVEKELFQINEDAIQKRTFEAVKIFSFGTIVLLGITVILIKIFFPILYDIVFIYSSGFFINCIIFFIVYTPNSKHKLNILFLFYFLFTTMFLFFLIATIFIKNNRGTPVPFCITLIIFSILMMDQTIRLYVYILSISILFLILNAIYIKNPTLQAHNVLSVSSSIIISFILASTIRLETLKNIEAERILKEERNIDALTSLPNRRTLFETIIASEQEKVSVHYTAAIMLDIDNFKLFNDTYGHQKGDEVLRQIGCFLKDFAFDFKVSAFRYGGEEFLILSENRPENEIGEIANRIVESVTYLNIPFPVSKYKKITFSAGYSTVKNKNNIHYELLITKADEALYEAKRTGKNKAVGYQKKKGAKKNIQRKKSFK